MASRQVSRSDFPRRFLFGVGTSSYQVEGKAGGRGETIWDSFARIPGNILDKSNGDVAADQYHRYKDDVDLMAKFGFGAYRFSISWARIFPDGLGTRVNEDGITYYNNLINALLKRGIQPFVTLYHWDLPDNLQKTCRGWLCSRIVEYFAIYAETCFARFGDRVRHWITINQPYPVAVEGYGTGRHAPGRSENPLTEPYLAAHHLILAHAKAVSIYRKKFQPHQGGEIGIAPNCDWPEPYSNEPEDRNAAERNRTYQLGWFLDPIFHGDYPQVMRKRLGDRLPKFSDKDKELLKDSVDFVGISYYTARYIAHSEKSNDLIFSYRDQQIERLTENSEGQPIGEKAASHWLYVAPWGLRKLLKYISAKYDNPPIYVTENGMDEEDDPNAINPDWIDIMRADFYEDHLTVLAKAIREDGVDVRGYFAWSLMDGFEWRRGYTKRFGLFYLDRKKGLIRHPKYSAMWFFAFLKNRRQKNIPFGNQISGNTRLQSPAFADLNGWNHQVAGVMNDHHAPVPKLMM